ncbi:16S rRNA (guanine966-N2)-methyltransferase [Candidatus Xenohaliotis californiensis]|uniref:16S rRNA (Guanine966-N2)-methyltransferase n=1 Tax=Candidatus Xenohaliotis californiensis TaxID=84677 RepID=A0ABP0EXR8_9RICK|nr:16S rRNA (guanine966-N2)-methyltransferase [Candidatus Xenohaliotis californiensis]
MSFIIAGKHRGRKIRSNNNIRPTMSKVREAVFNILGSRMDLLSGFVVADLFCGSGSMSLEAISRGAEHVFMLDNDQKCLATAWDNINSINANEKVTIINHNMTHKITSVDRKCDVFFIDPPYKANILPMVLDNFANTHICGKDSLIILELSKKKDLQISDAYKLIDQRRYGATKIIILQANWL